MVGAASPPGITPMTACATGLAQPKSKPVKKKVAVGTTRVPIKSMCLSGLKVTRPSRRAVWSPSRLAIRPWEASCAVTANKRGSANTDAN